MPESDATKYDLPWATIARLLWPEAERLARFDGIADEIADIPGTVTQLAGIMGAYFALSAAGMDPTVRAIQYSMNERAPNEIPGAGDLVRFVVREALDPSYRDEQMAGFNQPAFFSAMRSLGFSQEWAEAYWRAHWDLPSPTQVAEMVHRLRPGRTANALGKGVPVEPFTLEDARRLFQQADLMPRYIDQMLAITYAPMTRVDIRRAFHLGAISDAEMYERYRDIGYDEDTARVLTDFTKRDLEPDERDITLGQATLAFREDIISVEELTGLAKELGLSARGVELYVRTQQTIKERLENKKQEKRAKTLTRLALKVRRASRTGRFVEDDLRLELEELELTPPEIDEFLARHVQAEVERARDLTPSQAIAAFKKGVWSRAETVDALLRLGYDRAEAETLIATATTSKK